MKSFVAIGALILLALSCAFASVQPKAVELLPVVCGGNPNKVILVTATNPADGSMSGREFESTRCALSGRPPRTRLYTACADMLWDASGNLLATPVRRYNLDGTAVITEAQCWALPIW